jgi:2-iminobutanoate/2-iminopropanoate deaminase
MPIRAHTLLPEDYTMFSLSGRVRVALAVAASFAALASPVCARAQVSSAKQVIVVPGANRNPNLSAAVRVGDLLFISGQLGGNDSTIEGQTTQALENMKKVLDAAGTTVDNVVKCTVFLTDMKEFAKMNESYRAFFSAAKDPPGRSAVAVLALARPTAKVEIECIAAMPK